MHQRNSQLEQTAPCKGKAGAAVSHTVHSAWLQFCTVIKKSDEYSHQESKIDLHLSFVVFSVSFLYIRNYNVVSL